MRSALSLSLGLLPVLLFLLVLVLLDSYKLVPPRRVLGQLVLGALAALASLAVGTVVMAHSAVDPTFYARYLAPPVEELLKGSAIVALLLSRRLGFLVDAAILGFAVGAGFSAVENIHYFDVLHDASPVLWAIRGFGTAVMHGSVSAIMAVIVKDYSDRRGAPSVSTIAPAWALAAALHSGFNHFFLSPNVTTALLLVVLPVFFGAVFVKSEARVRSWLGTGFDTDQELLTLINSGRVSTTRTGQYLESLRLRFPPTVVVDMVCLLRLRLELSIRAKGILLMNKAGFRPEPDPAFNERFAELKFLEHSIGSTGLLAMAPILHMSDRELWQYHMLGARPEAGTRRRTAR